MMQKLAYYILFDYALKAQEVSNMTKLYSKW